MILFQDGFAQYNTLEAFLSAKGGEWKGAIPSQITYNSAKYGGAEIKRAGLYMNDMMVAELSEDTDIVAVSFFMRTNASTGLNMLRVGFNPRSWLSERTTNSTAPIAFEFSVKGSVGQEISHSSPTQAPPSIAMSSVKIYENRETLAVNEVYHVNMLIDMRVPASSVARVFINGSLYGEATFNRDRLTNGYQPISVGAFVMVSGASQSSGSMMISDLVVYKPDDDHPFPMDKPLKIRYYAPSAVLATPADDTTYVTVNTDTFANYPIPAGSVPETAEVIGAKAYVRMRAAEGASYANADVKLTIGGVDEQIVLEGIPSGFLSKLFSKTLTLAQSTPAAINASIFKMRSPE